MKKIEEELLDEIDDAIYDNDLETIKQLFIKNPELLFYYDNFWLCTASSYSKYDVIDFLLEKGLNINKSNSKNGNPLFIATAKNDLELLRFLLNRGAILSEQTRPYSLFCAISNGNLELIKTLIEMGEDIHRDYENESGEFISALDYAMTFPQRKEIIEFFQHDCGRSLDEDIINSSFNDYMDIKYSRFIEMKESRILQSKIDENDFIRVCKEALVGLYEVVASEYSQEHICGLSFEIANTVAKVYEENFDLFVYVNTVENIKSKSKDITAEEMVYLKYSTDEWFRPAVSCEKVKKLQRYIISHMIPNPLEVIDYCEDYDELGYWIAENEVQISELYEAELKKIRFLLAKTIAVLTKQDFWRTKDNNEVLVIPFSGDDCEIRKDEVLETYLIMSHEKKSEEYLDYLEKHYN